MPCRVDLWQPAPRWQPATLPLPFTHHHACQEQASSSDALAAAFFTLHTLLAGALDTKGKALWGVPAPGYTGAPLTAFPGPQTEGASAQMFRRAPAWTLGRRATRLEKLHLSREMDAVNAGLHSPGPKYDLDAAYRYLDQRDQTAFPLAERGMDGTRFISKQHISDRLCMGSPGPIYMPRCSRQLKGSLGNAPAWGFGRRWAQPNTSASLLGAIYQVPSTFGCEAPPTYRRGGHFSFAPMGQRRQGARRRRDSESKVYLTNEHSKVERNPEEARQMPGPGQYFHGVSDQPPSPRRVKAHSFGRACRLDASGSKSKEDASPDMLALPSTLSQAAGTRFAARPLPHRSSSAPLWAPSPEPEDVPASLRSPNASRGPSPDPEGKRLPGPGQYQPLLSLGKLSQHETYGAPKFGTDERPCNKTLGGRMPLPGPGAYKPEICYSKESVHAGPRAASFGANLRLLQGSTSRTCTPGPGQYRQPDGSELERTTKPRAPTTTWATGKSQDRNASFVQRSESPGPIYPPASSIGKSTTGPRFGRAQSAKVPAHSEVVPTFPSGGGKQNQASGRDSPGPTAHIDFKVSKPDKSSPWNSWLAGPRFGPGRPGTAEPTSGEAVKRTTAPRGSHVKQVSSRSDTPGPGQYNQQISVRLSKYQAGGTTSFGFGERTRMANVAF
eukprot:jgi/Astpho2/4336/fgenesh1_pg.00065_%23_20_t